MNSLSSSRASFWETASALTHLSLGCSAQTVSSAAAADAASDQRPKIPNKIMLFHIDLLLIRSPSPQSGGLKLSDTVAADTELQVKPHAVGGGGQAAMRATGKAS